MSGFTSHDPRLVCDFDRDAYLEASINDRWCKVDPLAFRSWTGPRRIDGEPYTGPVYQYLTNTTTERGTV